MHVSRSADSIVANTESTTDELCWVFDPLPPSGARQGGVPAAHVFKPDLETFVREVLQNARDQRSGLGPVRVQFVFDKISGKRKEEFLQAIRWEQLRKHVEAASAQLYRTVSGRLAEGLRSLDSEDSVLLLRIDDSGTYGLTGGEDEAGANFNALCRNILDTSEDRPMRGGSYGLGKAVLWSFSGISTVLFASRIEEPPNDMLRLFGRTELPYHSTDQGEWNGPGWFGLRAEAPHGGSRAASVWGQAAEMASRPAGVFRGVQLGTGTSILIVAFTEPQADTDRSLQGITTDLQEAVARWFWPSLIDSSLEVSVVIQENGRQTHRTEVGPTPEVEPFIRALTHSSPSERATASGEVAERELTFKVPGRNAIGGQPEEPEQNARLSLRITAASASDSPALKNTVAVMRGAGMVVQYRPCRVPLGCDSFYGVLRAGLARGTSDSDRALEQFLRAAEPPSHREWVANTPRVAYEYKRGGQVRLHALWRQLDAAVAEVCEERPPSGTPGPARLARLFRLAGHAGGSRSTPTFRLANLDAFLDDDAIWHFTGKIVRNDRPQALWRFRVRTWLAGETGPGEVVPINTVEARGGTASSDGNACVVEVPAGIQQVEFRGSTVDLRRIADERTIRLTRLRVEVQPIPGGGP